MYCSHHDVNFICESKVCLDVSSLKKVYIYSEYLKSLTRVVILAQQHQCQTSTRATFNEIIADHFKDIKADLYKVHGLVNCSLHQLLDVPLLLVRELMWVAARTARTSTIRRCQLVVVLPGAVCHQVGVVGWGGVGDCPVLGVSCK